MERLIAMYNLCFAKIFKSWGCKVFSQACSKRALQNEKYTYAIFLLAHCMRDAENHDCSQKKAKAGPTVRFVPSYAAGIAGAYFRVATADPYRPPATARA